MDLCNIKDIHALLSRHNFQFSKALGQNFLIAPWVPQRIAEESGADENSGVLEIGPGIGCLTHELSLLAGRVVAVELDRRLIPVLSETLKEHENTEVINSDVLKLDLNSLVEEKFTGLTPAVCANLPYNITSPVLTKLIDSKLFGTITVMIQKEVAQRIVSKPGSDAYGAFSVYANFHTEPKILFDVPASCFEPRPKVTSAVIKFTRRDTPAADCNEKLFFKIVRAAFNQRRKTLVNALSAGLGSEFSKDAVLSAVESAGFDLRVRGETLDIPAFAALTNEMEKLKK